MSGKIDLERGWPEAGRDGELKAQLPWRDECLRSSLLLRALLLLLVLLLLL